MNEMLKLMNRTSNATIADDRALAASITLSLTILLPQLQEVAIQKGAFGKQSIFYLNRKKKIIIC
jgi:hypothetical protein